MSRKKSTIKAKRIPLIGIDARFLMYLKPYQGFLIVLIILIVMVTSLNVLAPWPLKYIIDNVIGGEPFEGVVGEFITAQLGTDQRVLTAILGLTLIILTILQGITNFAYEYLTGIVQERSTFLLRSDVFNHVQQLPLEFYDQNRMGDVLKRVTGDSSRMMAAMVSSLGEFILNSVKFLGIALIMLTVNWRFSVIVLAYVPLLMFMFHMFRKNIKTSATVARDEEGEMANMAHETLGAIREVKSFGREAYQQELFDKRGEERMKAGVETVRWESAFSPVIDFIQAASSAAVIWYGVAQLLVGNFTIGALLIFMTYMKDMYRPLRKFSKLSSRLQKASTSGDRLSHVLDAKISIKDAPNAVSMKRAQGNVRLEHVNFAYPSAPDRQILFDVNLQIEPGQVVAFVGGTGAGKSTINNLVMRFYEVTGGCILLDGVDVRQIKLQDLRRQFAVVPQESVLMMGTLRDNLAYGNPEATNAQIEMAAKAANVDEFITHLPEGYNTVVGERGSSLSGGQRQRISIARAILRDSPMLILDEPTAALDAESEDLVMSALVKLMVGRTTFIIAHRLSTVRNADLIVVFEQGRVIEQGTHDELVQYNGHYAHLVSLQMGNGAVSESVLWKAAW